MAIKLTKTSKIIFAVVITVLSVSLGFLIWRVNQVDQLDPGDSDAGGGGSGCSASATAACYDSTWCKNNSGFMNCYEGGKLCGTVACGDAKRCKCCDGGWVTTNSGSCSDACKNAGKKDEFGGNCEDTPVVKCVCDSWSNGCGVNCTFPSDTQAKVDAQASGTCKAYIAMCNVNNGSVSIEEYKPGHVCYGKKDECKNPYAEDNCTPVNTCDGGSWVNKPSGNINYETDISFSAKAKDSDGIKKSSIVVKKGSSTLPVCTTGQSVDCISLTEAATETTISGKLSTAGKRLAPGNYTVSMSWKDSKDASSAACALSTTFTVLPQQTNPNWSITKSVVEQCIDEGTENPKSELAYTITIRNTGDGAGTISKVEDVLDSKVVDGFVQTSTITSPGTYAARKIVWNYVTPLSIAAGGSKVLTYKLVIDKDNFDTYSNTVTLTPVGSATVQAAANITADCEIAPPEEPEEPDIPEVPQTGIFDNTLGRIVVGFGLIVLGAAIYNVPNGMFKNRGEQYKYRNRFEKRVANR
jgi:hypothetical protein